MFRCTGKGKGFSADSRNVVPGGRYLDSWAIPTFRATPFSAILKQLVASDLGCQCLERMQQAMFYVLCEVVLAQHWFGTMTKCTRSLYIYYRLGHSVCPFLSFDSEKGPSFP